MAVISPERLNNVPRFAESTLAAKAGTAPTDNITTNSKTQNSFLIAKPPVVI